MGFLNGEEIETDLKNLIGKYVSLEDLHTAGINEEWGCLEFLAGNADIEPMTLYKYAIQNRLTESEISLTSKN